MSNIILFALIVACAAYIVWGIETSNLSEEDERAMLSSKEIN